MAMKKNEYSSDDVSILSAGLKVEGNIQGAGNMRIEGSVKGDVNVSGNLTLGETSEVQGDVKAGNITLSGKFQGTLRASEKVVLEEGSELHGDLFAKILVIEAGAKFDGKSNMTNSTQSSTVQNRPEENAGR